MGVQSTEQQLRRDVIYGIRFLKKNKKQKQKQKQKKRRK